MPAGSKNEKERKRRVVAKGVLAGKAPRAIAAEAGCKTRHVQRLAEEPATQFLITEMMAPHRELLATMARKAIRAVDRGLVAMDGRKADHMARLRAVGRYKQLVEMAQGAPAEDSPDGGPQVTWEEFVVMYRSRTSASE